MNITIVGFANIDHALVAFIVDKKDINMSILSSIKNNSKTIVSNNNLQKIGW